MANRLNVGQNAGPSSTWVNITASDTTLLAGLRGIYCVTAGTLSAQDSTGLTLPYTMAAGDYLPIGPSRVMAASTGTYYGWK